MKITVHVKGIKGSGYAEEGEQADAMFGGILEINGVVIDRVTKIETNFAEDFTTLKATFIPGEIEVLNHSEETWKELLERADRGHETARAADGRLIARHKNG